MLQIEEDQEGVATTLDIEVGVVTTINTMDIINIEEEMEGIEVGVVVTMVMGVIEILTKVVITTIKEEKAVGLVRDTGLFLIIETGSQ